MEFETEPQQNLHKHKVISGSGYSVVASHHSMTVPTKNYFAIPRIRKQDKIM
jgi:hypothetical protein